MYILRSATAYRLSDPLRSLSSLAIIHTYIHSDRSFCAWSPVVPSHHWFVLADSGGGGNTQQLTTMKRRTLLCLFPPASHHPKELVQFLKISYSNQLLNTHLSLSLFPSTYLSSLKLSSDAENIPRLYDLLHHSIFSLLFLDGPVSRLKCKCPWLGLATYDTYGSDHTPSRPQSVTCWLRHGSRRGLRLFNVHICKVLKMHEIIEASVET